MIRSIVKQLMRWLTDQQTTLFQQTTDYMPSSVPEFIDPVFTKTSPKRSFSLNRKRAFWLVFAKTGSIISGTGDDGVTTPPFLSAVFHFYVFNDDIYFGLPTCFLRAVCVYVKGGGGVSHRMWLCPVWGVGGWCQRCYRKSCPTCRIYGWTTQRVVKIIIVRTNFYIFHSFQVFFSPGLHKKIFQK